MASLGDIAAVACADVFAGDGAILASAMGAVPALGARLAQAVFESDLMITDGIATIVGGDGRPEAAVQPRRADDLMNVVDAAIRCVRRQVVQQVPHVV